MSEVLRYRIGWLSRMLRFRIGTFEKDVVLGVHVFHVWLLLAIMCLGRVLALVCWRFQVCASKQVFVFKVEISVWDYGLFWRLALVWVLPSRLRSWFHCLVSSLDLDTWHTWEYRRLSKNSRCRRLWSVSVRGQLRDLEQFSRQIWIGVKDSRRIPTNLKHLSHRRLGECWGDLRFVIVILRVEILELL